MHTRVRIVILLLLFSLKIFIILYESQRFFATASRQTGASRSVCGESPVRVHQRRADERRYRRGIARPRAGIVVFGHLLAVVELAVVGNVLVAWKGETHEYDVT